MRLPDTLVALFDQGIIEQVVRPLQSGKEAQVYLVVADGEERVAKVYKDSDQRSFKNRSQYTEGRRVRNSRDQRAIDKRTRHGRAQDEAAWKSAEVDVIYRLHAAGVRVPQPYHFIDGVLIMELVQDGRGGPAPRLAEVALAPKRAQAIFDQLLREVVKMLSAGIVHGDLSDYNVLVDEQGPVVIDFPQSVDASVNRNARNLLLRDVDNLNRFLRRFVPGAPRRPYGQELWAAYESSTLSPEMELTGRWSRSQGATDMSSLMYEIEAAEEDERRRRQALGQSMPRSTPRKREVVVTPSAEAPQRRRRRGRKPGAGGAQQDGAQARGPNEQRRGPDDQRRGPNDQRGTSDQRRGPNDQRRGPNDQRRGPNDQRGPNGQRRGSDDQRGHDDRLRGPNSQRGSSDQRGPNDQRGRDQRGANDQRRGPNGQRRPNDERGPNDQRRAREGQRQDELRRGTNDVPTPTGSPDEGSSPPKKRRRRRRRKRKGEPGQGEARGREGGGDGGRSSPPRERES